MNRPQTPVKGIISNVYGKEAEEHYMTKTLENKQTVSASYLEFNHNSIYKTETRW